VAALSSDQAICQVRAMTALDQSAGKPSHDIQVMSLIGTGHFFSHFYIMLLPPLFPLLKDEYGVGYIALGFALAVGNVVTGVTQAPVGFLVDRLGARSLLIAGLALYSVAVMLIGLFPSYPALVGLMALAGLGNSVFHPADYAILSAAVDERRVGRAFSIHTFGGYVGFALAPPVVVFLTSLVGWQTAVMLAGATGLLFALWMLAHRGVLTAEADVAAASGRKAGPAAGIQLLLSTPILMALLFYVLLSVSQGGYMTFGVASIEAIYRVGLTEANVPLTAYLVVSACGVLVGGWIADRTDQHQHVVGGSFFLVALLALLVPLWLPPLALLTVLFALAGFFSGVVAPSRDMLVRAVTPAGASGKVFGFVTTGFNIGGIIGPLGFGALLDFGDPVLVFFAIAALSLATMAVVYATARAAPAAPGP
jgi:FSR family fosmidomycin resistance protein-like MFS transporter